MNLMKPMRLGQLLLLAFLASCLLAPRPALAEASKWESSGPNQVETVKYDWHDDKRNRDVAVKIYYPQDAKGKLPIIVFSHGLGGSSEGYEYLGRFWASHGYVSVHMNHLGSDTTVWKGVPPAELMASLKRAVANIENAVNRPRDVSFTIDQLEKLNGTDSPLKGRLDLEHIGISGHSFGGFTTLAEAGEIFILPNGDQRSMADPRIKAAVAMSAPVPEDRSQLDLNFSKITMPVFHMTGTLDDSPVGETKASERRIPFDHIDNATEYLVIFTGGDHRIFSGRPIARKDHNGDKDPLFQKLICAGSTAFWDAYLKDDKEAAKWLADGGYQKTLGENGTFEKRLPAGAGKTP